MGKKQKKPVAFISENGAITDGDDMAKLVRDASFYRTSGWICEREDNLHPDEQPKVTLSFLHVVGVPIRSFAEACALATSNASNEIQYRGVGE